MLRVPSDILKIIHIEQRPRRQDGPDVPGEDDHHFIIIISHFHLPIVFHSVAVLIRLF